jgi:hypothetical protein
VNKVQDKEGDNTIPAPNKSREEEKVYELL